MKNYNEARLCCAKKYRRHHTHTAKSPLNWAIRWSCTLTGKGHYLCNVTTHVLTSIRTYAQTMLSCHRHRYFQFGTRENWANFTVKIWYHISYQQYCPLGESISKICINLNQSIEWRIQNLRNISDGGKHNIHRNFSISKWFGHFFPQNREKSSPLS